MNKAEKLQGDKIIKEIINKKIMDTATIKQKIVKISNELRLSKDGKNDFQKYNYFQPDDILIALNPLLAKYELIAIFNMPFSAEKGMYEGTLSIEDWITEEKVSYKFDIPLTEVKGSSKAQGAGATQTYCKRYMFMNAFNIADNSADLDSKDHTEKPKTYNTAPYTEKGGYDNKCACDEERVEKSGTKAGKPWRGMFCVNKKCPPVWLPSKKDLEDGYQSQAVQYKAEDLGREEETYPLDGYGR